MVSKNVENVLKTLKNNSNLMKELNNTMQKILDAARVDLSDEETSELFRTMTDAIIILDPHKDAIIIESKSAPQENVYQTEMEKGRKEGSLDFEMWLRHVKNLTGQTIFQMNINADPAIEGVLREEYAKWKGQKRNG